MYSRRASTRSVSCRALGNTRVNGEQAQYVVMGRDYNLSSVDTALRAPGTLRVTYLGTSSVAQTALTLSGIVANLRADKRHAQAVLLHLDAQQPKHRAVAVPDGVHQVGGKDQHGAAHGRPCQRSAQEEARAGGQQTAQNETDGRLRQRGQAGGRAGGHAGGDEDGNEFTALHPVSCE